MKALILAGGFGTRLKDVLGDVPKPMARIFDKPFLEHQINFLRMQNIKEIILALHHKANTIKSYFGNGSKFETSITYSEEETPLGTAGAIKNAERDIDDTFLVMNGDSYSHLDLKEFLEFHRAKRSKFTMSLIKSKNSLHYGCVIMDGSKITEFSEKAGSLEERLVNSGVYIFEPAILDYIAPKKPVSLEKDVFPRLAKEGKLYGYPYEGYFMDIGRPETYKQFRSYMLEKLILKPESNLRDAMQRIEENKTDLVLVCQNKKLLGVLNEKIMRRHFLAGRNLDDRVEEVMVKELITAKTSDGEDKIADLLLTKVNRLPIIDEEGRIEDVRFRVEEIKEEIYPEVAGKSPLRISFAGGGTDVAHFFEKYGGIVISSTIDKYCHARAVKRADTKIILSNPDLVKEDVVLNSQKDIKYDGKLDLVKAVIKVMKPEFGFELYMRNDIPPGRGLGSSASLAVLVIKLLSQLQGKKYDAYETADLAYKIERDELKIKGGWQDFYASLIGGFNFMEFEKDRRIVNPLRLEDSLGVVNELNEHLLLCYTGKMHSSGLQHKKQEEAFSRNEEEVTSNLNELKRIAVNIKDCLLTGKIEKIGELLHASWANKRKVDKSISNPEIDRLYETGLENGAYGGKLLGAGGGGYLLFFYAPKKRSQLTKVLEERGGEVLDFCFDFKGCQTWIK